MEPFQTNPSIASVKSSRPSESVSLSVALVNVSKYSTASERPSLSVSYAPGSLRTMTSLTPWSTILIVHPMTSIPSIKPSPSVSGERGSVDLPSTAPSPSLSLALNSSRLVNLSSSSTTITKSCSLLEISSPTATLMW